MSESEMSTESRQLLTDREFEERVRLRDAGKENTVLVDKIIGLERDNQKLRGERIKDGQVAVSKDDAALLEQYRTYGKPDELKTQLEERGRLQADLSTRDRKEGIRVAAEAAGFKPSVLERLLPDGATLKVQDVSINGAVVKQAVVTLDGKETPLSQWAAESLSDFMPALQVPTPSTLQFPPDVRAPTQPTQPAWVSQPTTTQQPSSGSNPLLDYARAKIAAMEPKGA